MGRRGEKWRSVVGRVFGPTATCAALQMAVWMGADHVILFGVDHSFKFVGDPFKYEKMQSDNSNRLDPN